MGEMSIITAFDFANEENLKFNIVLMAIKIFQVDAFVSGPFSGNPAAVCILDRKVDDGWMQNMAMQMNLSETAYISTIEHGFSLRWFTPTIEVDLCGHATLASAHMLWEEGYLEKGREAEFSTRSGMLTASKIGDRIELDFPSDPEQETEVPEGLIDGLGVEPLYVGKNSQDYVVEVESEGILRDITPNFDMLRAISTRGIIVTSTSRSDEYDFVSRFFAPASGIDEDPVTGSAHCCLGPYWSSRLDKKELKAYQASRRGGAVYVSLRGDRVLLGGKALTVFRGEVA